MKRFVGILLLLSALAAYGANASTSGDTPPPSDIRLAFLVTKNGTVKHVRVISSTVDRKTIRLVLDAVKHWRFQPAKRNGKPVSTWYELPIHVRKGGQPVQPTASNETDSLEALPKKAADSTPGIPPQASRGSSED